MTKPKSARQKSGRDPMDSMPLHVNDWLTSYTAKVLGRAGRDIYLTLLCHQWKAEDDGLPANPELLRRLVDATPEEWAEVWPLLERQFPTGDDGQRRNIRLLNERGYYLAKKVAGSSGGHAKASNGLANGYQTASKTPSNGLANDIATGKQKATPVPVPVPASSNEEEGAASSSDAPLLERFTEPSHRAAYEGFRRSSRNPAAVDAMLEGLASGQTSPGMKCYAWPHIGGTLLEMAAAGVPFTPQVLRGYVKKYVPAKPDAPVLEFGPPGSMWTGDGKAVSRGAA